MVVVEKKERRGCSFHVCLKRRYRPPRLLLLTFPSPFFLLVAILNQFQRYQADDKTEKRDVEESRHVSSEPFDFLRCFFPSPKQSQYLILQTMSSTTTTTTTTTTTRSEDDVSLSGHDEEQIRLMEERCIVLDNDDKYLRDGSKKECKFSFTFNSLLSLTTSTDKSIPNILNRKFRSFNDQHFTRTSSSSVFSFPLRSFNR